ncbi:hypothetical protein IVB34_12830 [Bradyrhizobium sp. 2]|uniref:hypothetical protein n=1 Tax=Bradyrhizobium sp. 2 TaxID=190045 RepID=UPI001FFBA61C|nr:hypothetical protein [Bradyrhizobium sp. 2]MCK1459173.1 hypothetical protein [Bradyrhizobium sp. 2]MCK1459240.1 hypothetical protein [Bradyrhizobium sp. 2]
MPHVNRRATAFLVLAAMAIFALIAVLILLMTIPARASTTPTLPAGITCEMVRDKVAEYGKAVAWAWALKQGYSFAQIAAARRCLK